MRQFLPPFVDRRSTSQISLAEASENAQPYAHGDDWSRSSQQTLTMNLDSVKSAARRAAWKADSKWDDFNPFSRTTSRESTLSRNVSQSSPAYDEEAAVDAGTQQNNTHVAGEYAGTKPLSGSPTSFTDVESQNGAAADYYRSSNQSEATTLSGETDSISKTASNRRRVNLGDVPEDEAVTADQEKESRGSVENSEEERKRRHTEMMKKKIPAMQQLRTVLFPRWVTINWLLIAAPIGIGLNFTSVDPLAIFVVNFIAIIPLAGLLSFATEEIALRVGEVIGGLLNASFG
jgi:Ca2+:H+ antiporter